MSSHPPDPQRVTVVRTLQLYAIHLLSTFSWKVDPYASPYENGNRRYGDQPDRSRDMAVRTLQLYVIYIISRLYLLEGWPIWKWKSSIWGPSAPTTRPVTRHGSAYASVTYNIHSLKILSSVRLTRMNMISNTRNLKARSANTHRTHTILFQQVPASFSKIKLAKRLQGIIVLRLETHLQC